jgi:asparagine synthase (glutamine-hydrolysing)
MCGLAGIAGTYPKDVAGAAIARMTSAQAHRGPDDEGVELIDSQVGTVALGSRRLAIIDLTPAGHQPMRDEVNGNTLAYNGEIYNFPELRDELMAKGHTFTGRGDTEALLIGYREWGREVLDRLRGMFAFALWDAEKRTLLVARDHLGIKPLYYAQTSEGFICASEVKALLAGELFSPTLDKRALAGFLAYGAVQEPLTIVEQIKAVPAGSWMEIDGTGRTKAQGRYWDFPEIDPNPAPEGDLITEGRALLEKSVQRHLLSDVPLGVFLSSGIDSTATAGLAKKMSDHDVHAFTVSFPGIEGLDEEPIAAATAQRLGLVFNPIAIESSTALEWVTAGLASMDQPAMDGINTYIVSRAVKEAGLTVAISGQGGDEVFGGYNSFSLVPRLHRMARATRPIPRQVRSWLAATAVRPFGSVRSEKVRDIAAISSIEDVYLMFRRSLSNDDMFNLGYSPAAFGLTRNFLDPSVHPERSLDGDSIAAVGRLETRFYLGNTLLRDGDVYSMANSLELRVPFLDRDLVDWAFRLPGSVLLPRKGQPKHLLREMCRDVLGPDQLERPKQGFNMPVASWMQGPLAKMKMESLEVAVDSGLVDRRGIDAIESRYRDDKYRSAWTRIWTIVALGQWLESNPSLAK